MNGLKIVQLVFENLRKPSETALRYQTILNKTSGVVKKKKLDLALSEQNTLAETSAWFTPSASDFVISDQISNVLLPIRVEWRGLDSDLETGAEVPIVNYQILNDSYGAVSFYGNPLRMIFRDELDTVTDRQFRMVYESDFSDTIGLANQIKLPDYFTEYVAALVTAVTLPLVEDNSPEYKEFVKLMLPILQQEIIEWEKSWREFVRKFRGKSRVPKRTFLDRNRCFDRYRIRRY